MRKIFTVLALVLISVAGMAQKNVSKGKVDVVEKGKGYYYESIMKDVNAVQDKQEAEEPYVRFTMDQSG